MFPKIWSVIPLLIALCLVTACGGSTAPDSTQPTAAPQPNAAATEIPAAATLPAPDAANLPPACGLLTAADVEKITGYGNGIADSRDLGEGTTFCSILAEQGKFKAEVGVGRGNFPVLPTEKVVELEGGAKGIVKDSGIGQGWMSLVHFPDYSVTVLFAGTAVTIDPDKKIATVTKADGSTMTYEETYEALARAVAHNAATGAQVPGNVSKVEEKGDPCALLTRDDVQGVMSEFDMTGPESSPSAYGGNNCRYRGHSDTLKTIAIVSVVYLTQAQFEQARGMTTSAPTEIGGATAYQVPGFALLLNKGSRYVNLSIATVPEGADTLEQINAGLLKWLPQLGEKIAGRM